MGPSPTRALPPRFELVGWRLPAASIAAASWVEVDVEGDGENEIFVGAHDAPARIWKRGSGGAFEELTGAAPEEVRGVTAAVAADFDGDGYADLFLGRAPSGPFEWPGLDPSAGWDRLWMNRLRNGRRTFVEATWSPGHQLLELLSQPALANLPHFPLLPHFPVVAFDELRYTHGAIARDFDGDGDADLALAHGGWDPLARRGVEVEPLVLPMECAVYWNRGDTNGDGFPNFADEGALLHDDPDTPSVESSGVLASSVAASDFDGDGDLDLYFGIMALDRALHFGNAASGAPNRYYEARRDAAGRLRWQNRSLRALGPQAQSEETRAVFALQLDAAAPVDLVVFSFQDARSIGGAWHRHRVLRYDRAQQRFVERLGVFAGAPANAEELCASVAPFDHGADGDLDFLVSGPRLILIENRSGSFVRSTAPAFTPLVQGTTALALGADANRDGTADLFRLPEALLAGCLREQPRWLARAGSTWEDVTAPGLPLDLGPTSELLVADFSGDGRRDVMLLKQDGSLRSWRALDEARFSEETAALPSTAARWIAAAAWDVDRQNGIDVVLIDALGAHAWWCNDGRGRFASRAAPADPFAGEVRAARVLAADFDGDGIEDALVLREARDGSALPPLRWTGSGAGLSNAPWCLPAGATSRSALGAVFDADGDGRSDVLCWNAAGRPEIWQSLAGGIHQRRTSAHPATAVGVGCIASSELNSDGVPDLYLAAGDPRTGADRLWLSQVQPGSFPTWSDGAGHPLLAHTASPLASGALARFQDLDGDGREDFAIGREGGRSCFLRRLPSGGWSPPEAFPDARPWQGRGWTSFDQDGDGLLEVWIYGASQVRSYRHRGGF